MGYSPRGHKELDLTKQLNENNMGLLGKSVAWAEKPK